MLKEFKEFALKGNVVDLAIAVIIGGAFGKVISSFVNDIIMPPIGMLLGGVSFSDLFISLDGQVYPSLAVATGSRGSHPQLRGLPDHHHRFCDHRLGAVPGCESHEPHEEGSGARRSHHQDLPAMRHGDPDQSRTLPALHIQLVNSILPPEFIRGGPGMDGRLCLSHHD